MNFSNPDLKELACLIYETLKNSGINVILVGGACVSIYSHNRYQSSDLDFATYEEMKPIEKALAKLGFRRMGRQFSHDQCPYLDRLRKSSHLRKDLYSSKNSFWGRLEFF
jgi:hypothetical protein